MSDDLLRDFIFDAREHLGTAGARLLDLEKNPDSLDSLNALMGILHTIKGNSGLLDLKNLYTLLHHAESLLQTLREKKADCPSTVIDLLLQVLDTAEAILNRLGNQAGDGVDWLETLNQALSEAANRLEANLADTGDGAGGYAPTPAAEPPDSPAGINFSAVPGTPTLVRLADGDLARTGDHFPAQAEALFKAGGSSLVVDLTGLTSLTARELKLLWAASREKPDRTVFLVDPAEQPDLYRLFQVLGLDRRLSLCSDQALANLGAPA